MNIVYLIGNGFDVSQGALTRYSDFYKSYVKSSPVNDVEERLIDSIKGDIESWSNMEARLGVFTKDINDYHAFENAYDSLSDKLRDYLLSEEKRIVLPGNAAKYLSSVLAYFTEREQMQLLDNFNRIAGDVNIYVVSFNYTKLFERAIAKQKFNVQIEPPFIGRSTILRQVVKIHGSLESTMLMGVNDKSQIANVGFAENQDICDFLIKPQANYVIGDMKDSLTATLISNSDVVVVFGMSIGSTDKSWWQMIYTKLRQQTTFRLLLFYYTDSVDKRKEYKNRSKKEEFKKHFFDIVEAKESDRYDVSQRIYVSLSKRFFAKEEV